MSVDVDLNTAVDVVWFLHAKLLEEMLLLKCGLDWLRLEYKKFTVLTKFTVTKFTNVDLYGFFPKFPYSESNILWCGNYTYSEVLHDGIAFS